MDFKKELENVDLNSQDIQELGDILALIQDNPELLVFDSGYDECITISGKLNGIKREFNRLKKVILNTLLLKNKARDHVSEEISTRKDLNFSTANTDYILNFKEDVKKWLPSFLEAKKSKNNLFLDVVNAQRPKSPSLYWYKDACKRREAINLMITKKYTVPFKDPVYSEISPPGNRIERFKSPVSREVIKFN